MLLRQEILELSVSKSNVLGTIKLHFACWFQRPHSPISLLGMLIKSKMKTFLATYDSFLSECPEVVVPSGTNTSQMEVVRGRGSETKGLDPSQTG